MSVDYEALKKEIAYHSHKYYVLDAPEITDQEYDKLMRTLLDYEKEHPEKITLDSPSQKIAILYFVKTISGLQENTLKFLR